MSSIPLTPELTLAASVAFMPLSTIAMGLRFYWRRRQQAPLSTDDWLIIPAYVCLMSMQITMTIETVKHQLGYPDPARTEGFEASSASNHPFYPVEIEQIPAIGLIKLSLVFFYTRVLGIGAPLWFKKVSWVLIAVIIAWMISFLFCWFFICKTTPSIYWESSAAELEYCVKTQVLHNALAISDAIIDLMVVAMALPVVWRLKMTKTRKLAVSACFLLGLVTLGVSLARMAVFLDIIKLRYANGIDLEHIISLCLYWSMIEVGLAFLVANAVVFYGLIVNVSRSTTDYLRRGLLRTFGYSTHVNLSDEAEVQWPPAPRGNVHCHIESAELSMLKTRDSELPRAGQIKATTVVEQSAERLGSQTKPPFSNIGYSGRP